MEKGFTYYFRGQDNFFKTERQYVTKAVAREILSLLMPEVSEFSDKVIREVQYGTYPATYEIKEISTGRKWADIVGVGFNFGDFIDNYQFKHHFELKK